MEKHKGKPTPFIVALVVFIGRTINGIVNFIGNSIVWSVGSVWRGLQWSLKQAWGAFAWLVGSSWRAFVWSLKRPFLGLAWVIRLFSGDYLPEFETLYQREAYLRVRRYYRRRRRFLLHMFVFGAGVFFIWYGAYEVHNWAVRNGYPLSRMNLQGHFMLFFVWTLLFAYHYAWLRMKDAEADALMDALDEAETRGETRATRIIHMVQDERETDDDTTDEDHFAKSKRLMRG